MRLLGNKCRLVGEIEKLVSERGIVGGTFFDIFSGTSSVGAHFKRLGFRVVANDHLSACYTKAVAAIEVNRYPDFAGLRDKYRAVFASRTFRESLRVQARLDLPFRRLGGEEEASPAPADARSGPPDGKARSRRRSPDAASSGRPSVDSGAWGDPRPLEEAVHLLSTCVAPKEGLISRNYCPGGARKAMYFTDANGRRIDGMLDFLRENYRERVLTRWELHLLLSALLDAADRVANISGTYGSYLKTFQPNARASLTLKAPEVIVSGLAHEAHREDANELVRKVSADVLYVDPPYNDRQYAANYHILEVIAEHHRVEDLEEYESALYGKTGLRPYEDLKSAYCVAPSSRSEGRNALSAMTDLILSCRARHVVVSYNEEGLLTREELGAILSRFSGKRSFDYETGMRTVLYRRFRSDADRPAAEGRRPKRLYKILEGRRRDEIAEWLLYAVRPRSSRSPRAARPGKVS